MVKLKACTQQQHGEKKWRKNWRQEIKFEKKKWWNQT